MAKVKKVREKKLSISACYIVRDNAAELKISLNSLKNFVNEIIVIDTGSVDETAEVAKSFGAKVFFQAWQDDFSTPRNFALKKASGDWVIFLDADEFFSAETAKNIPFVVERAAQFKKNAVQVFLVNIDKDNGNRVQDTDYVVRIFKHTPQIQYVGKIHEELRFGGKILSEVVTAPPELLTLYHTGYSASLNRSKAQRNLKMLLAELDDTTEPQRIYHYIAQCYNGLGDVENALKFARLDIDSDSNKKIFSYRLLLSLYAQEKKYREEREEIAARAVKDFPKMPEFTAELAECFATRGDFQQAIETMASALDKFKNYSDAEPTQFSESAAKFAERRMELWTKLAIAGQYPSFSQTTSDRWILSEDTFLTEENNEKN